MRLRADQILIGRIRRRLSAKIAVGEKIVQTVIVLTVVRHVHGETTDDGPVMISRRHEAHYRVRLSLRVLEPVSLDCNCLHERSLSNLELNREGLIVNPLTHILTQLLADNRFIKMVRNLA